MSRHLASRLTYLWTFELVAAAVFIYLVSSNWDRAELGPLAAGGLALVVFLLCQGSLYWFAKSRSLRRRPVLTDGLFRRLFGACRGVSLAGVAAMAVALLAGAAAGTTRGDMWVGLGLWALAGLEYINYYHWQLMYDTPREVRWLVRARRLKPAALGRDLKAGRL